jgi:hypothetical protein
MASTEGCYPRLNASLIQSHQYDGCELASLVGTLQSVDASTSIATLRCCDGGFVQVKLDADFAIHTVDPSQAIEIMGTVDERGTFTVRFHASLSFYVTYKKYS